VHRIDLREGRPRVIIFDAEGKTPRLGSRIEAPGGRRGRHSPSPTGFALLVGFWTVLDVRAHPMDRRAARIDSSDIDNAARFSEPAAR
jgi:hypothetical protein